MINCLNVTVISRLRVAAKTDITVSRSHLINTGMLYIGSLDRDPHLLISLWFVGLSQIIVIYP